MNDTPPLGLIDLPWWVIYSAPLRAEQLDQEAWITGLAAKWRLVTGQPGLGVSKGSVCPSDRRERRAGQGGERAKRDRHHGLDLPGPGRNLE
jgi:hypothetical protein